MMEYALLLPTPGCRDVLAQGTLIVLTVMSPALISVALSMIYAIQPHLRTHRPTGDIPRELHKTEDKTRLSELTISPTFEHFVILWGQCATGH